MTLSRIAFIYKSEKPATFQRVAVLKEAMQHAGIDCRVFSGIVPMVEEGFDPDCVLILNAGEAKLGHWPTYAVLDASPASLLSKRRLIRNVLTCDGYLVTSPFWEETVTNLAFSARKFGAVSTHFGLTPTQAYFGVPKFGSAKIAYISSDLDIKKWPKKYFIKNLRRGRMLDVFTSSNRFKRLSRMECRKVSFVPSEVADVYHASGIGLDLFSCDEEYRQISWRLQEIIASGAAAITNWSPYLYNIFGENLFYIPMEATPKEALKIIRSHVEFIRSNPNIAKDKAARAYAQFKERFAIESLLPNIEKLHDQILYKQGYRAPVEPRTPDPFVSIIMRTGARSKYIRRALDSLVAQSYPDIQVVLVPYQPVQELEKLRADYSPRLKFKVVENIGGLRSKSVLLGMQHADGDYFGMLDDDDTVSPNHIRSLINTINYHNNLDWRGQIRLAYSGAYFVSDSMTFQEPEEWRDDYLTTQKMKRQIEHYRFYDSAQMAQRKWHMMSNSWLAHRSLLDHELLQDPHTHTGEDLHFEMQFALRTQFAFSGEVTAAHWFYGGNATIVDSGRNVRDDFRYITRLCLRSFPISTIYRLFPHKLEKLAGIEPLRVPKANVPAYMQSSILRWMPRLQKTMDLAEKFIMHLKGAGLRQTVRHSFMYIYNKLSGGC